MSRLASIRGWFECSSFDEIEKMKEIIHQYFNNERLKNDYDKRCDYYIKSWVFQTSDTFVFYGANINNLFLDFIKNMLIEASEAIILEKGFEDEILGIFYIDIEDGESFIWEISNGNLKESKK